MNAPKDRDWPAALTVAALLALALVSAMLDPACQPRRASNGRIYPTR